MASRIGVAPIVEHFGVLEDPRVDLAMGQTRTADHSNEITAIPELHSLMELTGNPKPYLCGNPVTATKIPRRKRGHGLRSPTTSEDNQGSGFPPREDCRVLAETAHEE